MNPLLREYAPIPREAWKQIEEECKRALTVNLAARQLVDVEGPLGWSVAALPTGRVEAVDGSPIEDVTIRRRESQPMIELEATFRLDRSELDALARGADDPDLTPAGHAAERLAHAEDRAVFHGLTSGTAEGIVPRSAHDALVISEDYSNYPSTIVEAIERLRSSAVAGPYALALGPRCHAGVLKASDANGFPVLDRLEQIVDGPMVRSAALDGALVISLRGGDFRLAIGQDTSVGYLEHTDTTIALRLIETIAFRIIDETAAVPLIHET